MKATVKPLVIVIFSVMNFASMAATIEWNVRANSINLDSSGARMSSGFIFQLGVFSAGFQPTASNIADWDEHWHAADTAVYNPSSRAFGSSFKVASNIAPFNTGAQGWIMGTKETPTGTEKILFRRTNWTWPTADLPRNPASFPREWSVARNTQNLQVVIASVDPEGSPFLMRSTVVRSYEQWRKLHLENEALDGPNDSPMGDGIPNVMKFAFGMDPRGKTKRPETPVEQVQIGNETYLKMRIAREGVSLAQMRVEVSSDLVNWHHGPAFVEVVSDNAHEWVVRDRTPFSATGGRRFMRLMVDLPKS